MPDFGEWLPDLAGLDSPGTPVARNVRPALDGFNSANDLAINTNALDNFPRGAYSAKSNAGDSYNYVGDGAELYQLDGATWTKQSKAGGYSLSDTDHWEMARWLETIITVGGINATTPVNPQVITMGPVGSTQFADLGGNPPQARHIAVIRGFVVLGNVYESAQNFSARLRWSGLNDPEYWQVDAAKQSDFQDLKGGGAIQSIAGGEYGVVVQEQSTRRMDYTGSKVVFAIEETLPGIGTPAARSVVRYGDIVFFLGRSGFHAVRDGSVVEDIGANKIDLTFYRNVQRSLLHRVIGALDRVNEQIVWIYPGANSSGAQPNFAITFDLKTARWGNFELEVEDAYDGLSTAFTLEGLDALYTSIEDVPGSLDDPQWSGGAAQLVGFNPTYQSGAFSGDVLPAVIETREQRLSQGRTHLNKVRPNVELYQGQASGDITAQALYRDNIGDVRLITPASNAARDGNFSARSKAYYHTLRANINTAFSRARGIDVVTVRATGKR